MRHDSSGSNSIFLTAPTYGSGGLIADSVAVADVNGDGKLDLVVANSASDTVGVLLGNGDGTFQAAVTYGSGGYAYSVAAADVNGDGKPDLLVANGNGVGVLLGNGDGTFQTVVTYGSGGQAVAVADVNGDGKLDLVVASGGSAYAECGPQGWVAVLLGNGDGTFQPAVNYAWGGNLAMSVAVADVNGDGKLDLVVAGSSFECAMSGGVGVLLGNGDGTFQAAVNYYTDYGSDSVAVVDVNGDGKLDLVVANYCGPTTGCWFEYFGLSSVGVLLGNGDGTFQAEVSYSAGGYFAYSVVVGDVNGDGKPDLAVTAGSGVSVLLGNGDGTFQAAVSYGSGGYEANSVALADVNRDGKPDLLVANGCPGPASCVSPGVIGVLLGNGDGTFQAAPTYYSTGYEANSVAVADLNGDGKLDVVVANYSSSGRYSSGDLGVLLGNGDGTFQTAVSYDTSGAANSVVVADVNGDGKPDLLVAVDSVCYDCSVDETVDVLLGNGDGTFQTAVGYASGGDDAASVAVADVNGDGKPDLLVANYDTSSLSVLLGNGDGTFQAAVSYGSGGYEANSVAVADMNGDGKPDLVVANECTSSSNCTTGSVDVLLGNGDGTFQAAVSYGSGGQGTGSVAVVDVNGDGKLDIITDLGVLLGNGDGTFQAANPFVTPGSGVLAVTDFNGDGKLDVAFGSSNALLLGNGDGTFQSPLTLGESGSGGIAVGDFNRDGRPDLAVGGASSVTVLLNISSGFRSATTTTVTSSSNPSAFGQSVTFTATVTPQGSGTPTGTVTFYDGTNQIGSGQVTNNTARLTISSLSIGNHSITASYSGDLNFSRSTSTPLKQVVTKATTMTTLLSSINPSVQGKPVIFTASVSSSAGTPTGKVKFLNGTSVLATVTLTSGSAKYTTSKLAPGSNSITAVYLGDSNNNGSTSSPLNQFVLAATTTTLTSSPNPSFSGQSVFFTAAVASSIGAPPDGETVSFKQGTTVLGTGTLSSGTATFSTSTLGVGMKGITAAYGGDSNFAASTSTILKQTVSKATSTTTLTSSQNPSNYGQSVTFTATVTPQFSGTPTGTVSFKDGTKTLKTVPLTGGSASYTTSKLTIGSHNINATYNGSSDFTTSSAGLVQTVQ